MHPALNRDSAPITRTQAEADAELAAWEASADRRIDPPPATLPPCECKHGHVCLSCGRKVDCSHPEINRRVSLNTCVEHDLFCKFFDPR